MRNLYKSKKQLINEVIDSSHEVLDLGFWGQAYKVNSPEWRHGLIKSRAKDVWGVDIDFDENAVAPRDHYLKASAEDFALNKKFDVITAIELIEHLSNPGLFLDRCAEHLKDDGKLILTTPNCFSLISMVEKLFKDEPEVNREHTLYFNKKVLEKLLSLHGFRVERVAYVDVPDSYYISIKRKLFGVVYKFLTLFTPKFTNTFVVIAKKK